MTSICMSWLVRGLLTKAFQNQSRDLRFRLLPLPRVQPQLVEMRGHDSRTSIPLVRDPWNPVSSEASFPQGFLNP